MKICACFLLDKLKALKKVKQNKRQVKVLKLFSSSGEDSQKQDKIVCNSSSC